MTLEERMTKILKGWLATHLIDGPYQGGGLEPHCDYCFVYIGKPHDPDCFWIQVTTLAKEQRWIHDWMQDENGRQDIYAWEDETGEHFGPRCVTCGYHYCYDCQERKVLCPAEPNPL